MHILQQSYSGMSLLVDLNRDRLFTVGMISGRKVSPRAVAAAHLVIVSDPSGRCDLDQLNGALSTRSAHLFLFEVC